MKYYGCFNLDGDKCRAMTWEPCPKDCFAKVTDPKEYARLLESLVFNNYQHNRNFATEARKELLKLRSKYDLEVPAYPRELYDTQSKFKDWEKCYMEDVIRRDARRGGGGDPGNKTPARKKDNRELATKWTQAEREEIREGIKEIEMEHGKLPRLSRRK